MKKSKILPIVLGSALSIPLAVGLVGCGKKPENVNVVAKDVYALSAASSVSYLKNIQPEQRNVESVTTLARNLATTSTTIIVDEDINAIKSCLTMFNQILQNNGISQTTTKNINSNEGEIGYGYTFVMEISLPGASGMETYQLYYNETETETEREIEDEVEEVEVSTKLEGIMVVDNLEYSIVGERTFETEGDESESTIEFITYLDDNNYVEVEQSVENDEIEYEYKIYENGKKVRDIELELETENNKTALEFQQKNVTTNQVLLTKYYIEKKSDGNYIIKVKKNNSIENINVEIVDDGYKFTYSEGNEQIVK